MSESASVPVDKRRSMGCGKDRTYRSKPARKIRAETKSITTPASAVTARLARISTFDTSTDPIRCIIVVGAVIGMKERTLASPPSGSLRITLDSQTGMPAGRVTIAEIGPASLGSEART